MSNPLFGGNGGNNNLFGPFGGIMGFMTQFNQFRSGIQGNPEQMVQQLRQNGKMNDAQFQYFSGIAQQVEQQIRQYMPFIRR